MPCVMSEHSTAEENNESLKRPEPITPNSKKRPKCNVKVEDSMTRAVKVIQSLWRNTFRSGRTYRLLENYFAHGPTIERVKSISFEALVVFLREKHVIALTKACLQRIHFQSTFLHGSPRNMLAPENVNVRIFLAAFMIAYRPTHVFESMGSLEQSLLESAIPLLESFEKIGRAIMASEGRSFSSIPTELTVNFPTMLYEYLKRFKAWKVPDEAKLSSRIKHALIALYQAEEHLPPDEPQDSKLKVEFRAQIERLRSKLAQIAGVPALEEFDQQRTANFGSSSTAKGPGSGSEAGSSVGGSAYAALPGRMTNEQLAHELLLDPTFQLDENGGSNAENPVFHRIRESFHQAFWDSLVDDLKLATPCYIRVLRVLAEVKEGINDLAGSRESGSLSEAVDLDFIKQQAESGLFGWANCKSLLSAITEIIQRVQAPKRDEETKLKWAQISACIEDSEVADKPRAFCKGLEFLLDRVNAMRIDAANARLRLIAPVIKDHGIDYERGKLQDKLNEGSLTLERTQEWIGKTVRAEVSSNKVDLQSLLDGKATAFVHIHNAAIISLVTDRHPLTMESCPETLLFDVHRLAYLQSEFKYISLAATILVTVGSSLAATRLPQDAEVLHAISQSFVDESRREVDMDQVANLLCNVFIERFDCDLWADLWAAKAAEDIIKSLERSTLSSDRKDSLRRALLRCSSAQDAVHQLMTTRIRAFFGRTVIEGKIPIDDQFMSAAKPLILRIEKAAAKLRVVLNVNRNVHLPHYNRIIGDEAKKL